MTQPLSFQEINRSRRQKPAFDLIEPWTCFEENLRLPPDDPRRMAIIKISGHAGVGKSWLLEHYESVARGHNAAVAKLGRMEQTPLDAMDSLALQMQPTGFAFDHFQERYHLYRYPEEDNSADKELYLHPQEVLSAAFLRDIAEGDSGAPIVWLIDSYEVTAPLLESWLLDLLTGKHGDLPAHFSLVIAGREPLDGSRWQDFQGNLLPLSLNPLTQAALVEDLKKRGMSDTESAVWVWDITGGLPLLVDMLAIYEDQKGGGQWQSLSWIQDQRRQKVLDAALAQYFNPEILQQITTAEEAPALFAWLSRQPFVTFHGGSGWFFHDLVRERMMHYQYTRSPEAWHQVHGKLSVYHEQKCADLERQLEDASSNKAYQLHAVEALYHRFFTDPARENAYAVNFIVDAIKFQGDFDLHCALALQQAERDIEIEQEARWGDILVEGLYAVKKSANMGKVRLMIAKLIDFHGLRTDLRAQIFGWRANLAYDSGKTPEAIEDLTQAIALDAKNAGYSYSRGVSNYALGRYAEALSDFNRAIELEPGNAKYHLSRGMSLHSEGRYKEAIADKDQAIALEPGNAGYHYSRSFSYHALGRYEDAIADISRVIELEPENGRHHITRGFFNFDAGHYKESLHDHTQAIELEPENAAYYRSRARCYQRLKQPQKAAADIATAERLEKESG